MGDGAPLSPKTRRFTVGYALPDRKLRDFLVPSFLDCARRRGLDLVPVESDKPLSEQGPFDCLLHKLAGDNWASQLRSYAAMHPDILIVDNPDAVDCLRNRVSMLDAVSSLRIPDHDLILGVPHQIVVESPSDLSLETGGDALRDLRFPVIAKPLMAGGTAKSHNMALVLRKEGLAKLAVPVVLQEFVNHGGVIFKVYVAGDYVKCVERNSLPDVTGETFNIGESEEGLVPFSRVSSMPAKGLAAELTEGARMPPLGFVEDVAKGLREVLGLRLFNFDLIRDARDQKRCLVIDINYFPGYDKLPSFEAVFTDFLLDIVQNKKKSSLKQQQGQGTETGAE